MIRMPDEPHGDASPDAVRFEDLGLSETSLQSLQRVGYRTPSPIQAEFIPVALSGQDCIGQARTGTGKTCAFVLPILERIDLASSATQALVLAPTRELSEQVAAEARRLAHHRTCHTAVLVGGRPIRRQLAELKQGVQLAVGTPGRVLDLLRRRALSLQAVRIVVLDEADRMLDIGFRPDIERILRQCPGERQTLLLSATLPPPVERLAQRYMRDPKRIDLSSDTVMVQTIEQFYITVDPDRKFRLLVHVLAKERPAQVLVFTRTKRGAEQLYRRFAGKLPGVAMIHGDLQQSKRDQVMQRFRQGRIRMLIATDVVGRGIDVSGISHIINYDVPEFCDDYVHRVGRTGRLSSDETGRAITFVTPDQGEQLTNIEKRINLLLSRYDVGDFETLVQRRRPAALPPPAAAKEEVEFEFSLP